MPHLYDKIRKRPIIHERTHECTYRAWHILAEVKSLLDAGVPAHVVREIIDLLESPLPDPTTASEPAEKG